MMGAFTALSEALGVPAAGALGLLALIVAWLGWAPITSWRLRSIPGPWRLPFLGNLAQIATKDLTFYMHEVSMKYGPVAKVWMGARPWVVVTDAAAVRKMSYKMAGRPLEGASFFGTLTGEPAALNEENILNVRGGPWKAARRAFESSVMHPERLKGHLPALRRCVETFLARLGPSATSGEPVDLKKAFGIMALATVGEVAYGVDFWPKGDDDTSDEAQLLDACRECFECLELPNASVYLPLQLMLPSLRPLWLWLAERFPDAAQRRHMRARQLVADVSRRLMARWREAAAKASAVQTNGHTNGDSNGHANGHTRDQSSTKGQTHDGADFRETSSGGISSSSFLAAMLEDRKQQQEKQRTGDRQELKLPRMNDIQVISHGLTFMLAGYDTTSTTLANLAFCLASNPAVQDKLRSELSAHPGCLDDVDLLGQLPYLDAVMKESQRLYTTAPIITRDVPADMDMGGGKVIPKSAFIISNVHTLHRDPQQWREPDRFLPERFLPETKGALGPADPNAFIPFGIGPRMCVGYKLATLTVKLTAAALLLRYKLELHPRQPLPYRLKTGLVMGPADGVWVSLTELHS